VKWLADENFDNNIVRGILRRSPRFDSMIPAMLMVMEGVDRDSHPISVLRSAQPVRRKISKR